MIPDFSLPGLVLRKRPMTLLEAWRTVYGNRRMPKRRALKKRGAKSRRRLRQALVSISGEHQRLRPGLMGMSELWVWGLGVSIPHSLRPYLGRWVGGGHD